MRNARAELHSATNPFPQLPRPTIKRQPTHRPKHQPAHRLKHHSAHRPKHQSTHRPKHQSTYRRPFSHTHPLFTCKFSHSAPDLSTVTGLQQACCSAADDKQCAWYNPANAFCNPSANYRCCGDVYQGVGQGCTTAVDISAKGIYEHVGPDMTSSNIGSPEGNLDLGGPEAELEKSGWLVK